MTFGSPNARKGAGADGKWEIQIIEYVSEHGYSEKGQPTIAKSL